MADHCDFGATKDEQRRDRIVIGIMDSDVSQKLQLEQALTLEKAIHITRQSELVKGQNAGARSAEGNVSAVTCKFKQFKPFEQRQAKAKSSQHFKGASKSTHGKECTRCGRLHEFGACPATGKRLKCNKSGHFEKMCKSKIVGAVNTTEYNRDEGCEWFLGAVPEDSEQGNDWFENLQINGTSD